MLVAVDDPMADVVAVVPTRVVLAVVAGGIPLDLEDVMDPLVDVVELMCGHVPGARSVRRVGVGVLGTLVFGAVPTVMVALPSLRQQEHTVVHPEMLRSTYLRPVVPQFPHPCTAGFLASNQQPPKRGNGCQCLWCRRHACSCELTSTAGSRYGHL